MVIGDPATGKTTILDILVQALQQLHNIEKSDLMLDFTKQKAEALDIAVKVENGEVMPASFDP